MLVGPLIPKQPGEVIPWTVDIAPILKSGETISGTPTFTAYELTKPLREGGVKTGNSATTTTEMKHGATVNDGTVYTQMIQAGTHGKNYVVELVFVTNLEQNRHAELEIEVRDVPE
jgi:hypothetical protein